MLIKIELPGVPPSLNQFAGRENTWAYRAEKESWTDEVCYLGRVKRPREPYDKAVVSIRYRFRDRRRRDPDNYCGKFLLDGLTKAGIIVDDSFSHIELRLSAESEPGEPRTTITVEEVNKNEGIKSDPGQLPPDNHQRIC